MLVVMEKNLWEFASTGVGVVVLMDPKDLEAHNLKDVKARRILLDTVKDHLIPHIVEKTLSKATWDALTCLY